LTGSQRIEWSADRSDQRFHLVERLTQSQRSLEAQAVSEAGLRPEEEEVDATFFGACFSLKELEHFVHSSAASDCSGQHTKLRATSESLVCWPGWDRTGGGLGGARLETALE